MGPFFILNKDTGIDSTPRYPNNSPSLIYILQVFYTDRPGKTPYVAFGLTTLTTEP